MTPDLEPRHGLRPWRPSLPRPRLGDLVAGLSVALVLVPQALAYAELAGMPAVTGLVTAAVATIAAAPFASSPYLQTGPVAVTGLLTFGALASVAEPGTAAYVGAAALLAVLVGVLRLVIGACREGAVAYLMSQPVLAGFLPAAALVIIVSQLPSAVGVPPAGRAPLQILPALLDVASWRPDAVLVALATGVTLLLAGRIHRLVPAVLVAVAVGWGLATVIGYGGPVLGSVPAGLPRLALDLPFGLLGTLLAPAAVIAVVGFAEPAAIARTYARQTGSRWDADREFVSQGVANLAAGLFGGFPVGGSFGRSAVARAAGARTAWAGAVPGLLLLGLLPFAGVLGGLPMPVLAAVIVASVVRLAGVRELADLRRLSPRQFTVAAVTYALTVLTAPRLHVAVIVGVVLAIGLHLRRELSITTPSWREGPALHLRPSGVLYFGSTHLLETEVMDLLGDHPDVDEVVVHMDRLGRVDVTGALALRAIGEHLAEAGVRLTVEDTTHASERIMERVMPA